MPSRHGDLGEPIAKPASIIEGRFLFSSLPRIERRLLSSELITFFGVTQWHLSWWVFINAKLQSFLISSIEQRNCILGFVDAFHGKEAGVRSSGLGIFDRYQWSEDTLVSLDLSACQIRSLLTSCNLCSHWIHVIYKPVSGMPVLFFIPARVRRKQCARNFVLQFSRWSISL
jgi:hypothetical protein